MAKTISMLNKKIGRWTVLELSKNTSPIKKWICKCDCGKIKNVAGTALRNGKSKSCGCLAIELSIKRAWKGYGEVSATFLYEIKRHATDKNRKFNLTAKYLWNLFLKQKRCCALSGIPLSFASGRNSYDGNASVDRIDSSKGYIIGNVQWVDKKINLMKSNLDQKIFINLCQQISKFQN